MPFFTTPDSKNLYYTDTRPSGDKNSSLNLVFIHGLGSSSSFYFPIIPHLSSLGHRCIALDTYGSGSSPYNGKGNSIASIAADVHELLASLKITSNVVLVGHSMGGIVASQIAAAELKGAIRGVVLVGPVHPNPGAAEVFANRIKTVQEHGMEAMATTIPNGATAATAAPLARAFIRELLIGQDPEGYNSLCRAIAEAPVPDYARVKVPLLIFAGDEDKSAPLDGCKKICEAYGSENGRKEVKVLSGVGHWHVLEDPGRVGESLAEFLVGL